MADHQAEEENGNIVVEWLRDLVAGEQLEDYEGEVNTLNGRISELEARVSELEQEKEELREEKQNVEAEKGEIAQNTMNLAMDMTSILDVLKEMNAGDYSSRVDVDSDDEVVQQLANMVNELVDNLSTLSDQARAISRGNFSAEVMGKDVEGDLGDAFAEMVSNLELLVDQAQTIADGDFTADVLEEDVEGELGEAFSAMVEQLTSLHSGDRGLNNGDRGEYYFGQPGAESTGRGTEPAGRGVLFGGDRAFPVN